MCHGGVMNAHLHHHPYSLFKELNEVILYNMQLTLMLNHAV